MALKLDVIYNENCIGEKGIRILPDISIDMVLADMPYGTTACKWDIVMPLEPLWEQLKRVIKPNGAIVLTASQPFTSKLVMSNLKMFKYEWIWLKSKSGSAFTAKYRPVNKHENILVFGNSRTTYNPQKTEGKPYDRMHYTSEYDVNNHNIGFNKRKMESHNNGFRYPITVQYFQQKWRRQDQLHPTQKPVALFKYLIKTYTNEGEIVLDFAIGSGTTAVACVNLNRKYIGYEISKKYCQIAQQRLLAEKTLWD